MVERQSSPQGAAAPRVGPPRRQDVVRNEQALLDAAGELLRENPEEATMPAIASRARLSVATAYRYFDSLADLHRRYLRSKVRELSEYSAECPESGRALLKSVLLRWIEIVHQYGPAMTQIRSREGFLTRLADGEELVTLIQAAWGRPIRELMAEYGVPNEEVNYALSVCNALFNSREVLDARTNLESDSDALAERLATVFCGALASLGAIADGGQS